METDDVDQSPPPFWYQPPTATVQRRRGPLSLVSNPVALILTTPVITLLFLCFSVPPLLSHAHQIFRPKSLESLNVVLVLFAILCGVLARRNDDEVTPPSPAPEIDRANAVNVGSATNWLDFPDQSEYNRIVSSRGMLMRNSSSYPELRVLQPPWDGGGNRRSSKYFDDFDVNFYGLSPPPEIIKGVEEVIVKGVVRDDEIPVDKFEVGSVIPPLPSESPVPPPPPLPPSSSNLRRRPRRSVNSVPRAENNEREEKGIDEFSERKEAADERSRPTTAPPPPPPPVSTVKRRPRRSTHSVVERERKDIDDFSERKERIEENSRPISPPLPPPPPTAEVEEEGSVGLHRKKNGASATKEIATAIGSLTEGQQRKREKKSRSRDIYEIAPPENSPPSSQPPPPPQAPTPPPPPPPPPPTKIFQNPFRKSGKNKRIHSVSTDTSATVPLPPPPPPPPNSIFNSIFKSGSKSKRFQNPSSSAPPPPPPPPPPSSILNSLFKNGAKSRRFKTLASTSTPPPPPPPPAVPPWRRQPSSGKPPKPTKSSAQYPENRLIAPPSPLIPLPPPLPPPPFTIPETKFVAKGDFVRIRSAHSSRCSSPDLEDTDDVTSMKSDGAESAGPISVACPSPDVNAKADNFIARLRGEWRLEKMNSFKGK